MKKSSTRTLTDSSWLAQVISDHMNVEFDNNGPSNRYHNLKTLYFIIKEADNKENSNIYYSNVNVKRQVIICEIPSLVLQHGSNFTKEGMQNALRGLAESYKDIDGQYLVSVLTTHDLNSCVIKDLSELLFEMRV